MLTLPEFARPVLSSFAPVFYHPTYQRFLVLLLAAVLTTGRRTVSNLLRTAAGLAHGDASSFHRVLSKRRWSTLALAQDPGPLHPRSLGPRWARPPGRRRYRQRAPRRQGLWQGLSPRPGALDPFLHRLPLGAQMGRPGDLGPVPLRYPGLGDAGSDGVVSQPGEGHESRGPGRQAPRKKAKDETKARAKERARRKASARAKGKAPRGRPRCRRGGGTRRPRN